jgi:hypothetical protein
VGVVGVGRVVVVVLEMVVKYPKARFEPSLKKPMTMVVQDSHRPRTAAIISNAYRYPHARILRVLSEPTSRSN